LTTLNETDPSSTSIDRIPLPWKTELWIAVTEAGMENRFSDRQPKNALSSIVPSLDAASKVTD
jgi:hypothetical protein